MVRPRPRRRRHDRESLAHGIKHLGVVDWRPVRELDGVHLDGAADKRNVSQNI